MPPAHAAAVVTMMGAFVRCTIEIRRSGNRRADDLSFDYARRAIESRPVPPLDPCGVYGSFSGDFGQPSARRKADDAGRTTYRAV